MKLHKLFDKYRISAEIHQRNNAEDHDWIGSRGRWFVTFPYGVKIEMWSSGESLFETYSIEGHGSTPALAWASLARVLSNKILRINNGDLVETKKLIP